MFQYIKECFFLLGKLFVSIWYFLVGFFMYSKQWKKQERAVQDMDIKFYYKKELRKKTSLMSTEEKLRISKFLKKTPRGERNDFRFYNYLITIVFRPRPDHTLKDAIKDFYLLLHPYFTTYYTAYTFLRKIVRSREPHKMLDKLMPALEKRFGGDSQDAFTLAERKLEIHKQVARDVGKKEREFKEREQSREKTIDKQMLEEEKRILENRMEQDKQAKENLEQAISDAEKNPML